MITLRLPLLSRFQIALSGLLRVCRSFLDPRRQGEAIARTMLVAALLGGIGSPLARAQTAPIVIAPQTLPPAIVGVGSYSQTLTATGGTGNKTFGITAGALPNGLVLSNTGPNTAVISGQPTVGGSFTFLVTATDGVGATGSWAFTLTVVGPPTVISPTVTNVSASTATLGGDVSVPGGAVMTARGVVYALTANNPMPTIGGPGVVNVTTTTGGGVFAVNVSNLLQGGAYTFRAYASNSTGTGYSAPGTFTTSVLSFTPATIASLTANISYATIFSATGGTPPYTFAVTGGAIPTGMTLARTGDLGGSPTTGGVFNFAITVTDAGGATRTQTYSITVIPPVQITTLALPDAGLNASGYFFNVDSIGGAGNKVFTVTAGSLPFGLTLDPSGAISGTPILAGSFTFTITATDPAGSSDSKTYTIVIGGPVSITTVALAGGAVNQTNYSQTVTASGGTGFKSFTVTAGSLPPGLTLSSNGLLSGTPSSAGTFTFTIGATDQLGESTTRSFTIVINAALGISPATLPDLPLNLAYSQTFTSSGGTGSKTFAVTSGALPAGLSLSAEGVLSGTPGTAGSYTFTITATDAAGAAFAQAYTVVVGGPIAISPATLTAPIINTPGFTTTLTASGGTGARTFAVTAGALPTGLTLSSTGVLSGTATAAGTYNFTVTATDAAGVTGERAYTLVVAPPVMQPQTITFGTLANRVATSGPITLSATSSSGLPVSYTVTGPAVLNGTTLTLTGAAGVVTVTATQAGNSAFNPATSVTQTFTVTPADRLVNLSARVAISPDPNRQLIAGFVVAGTQPKRVLLRAVGPGLTAFGVTGALVNPRLQVFDSSNRVILENDDWSGADTAAAFTQVGAFPLAAGSRDAALLTTLQPGSYTMQVTAGNETGSALAEVYDASANPGGETQRLVNISTRGNVDPGDGVLIGGFAISGVTPKRVLIRGIGPTLGAFGVGGTLADPRLGVYSGANLIAQNDDWSQPTALNPLQPVATAAEVAAAAQAVGAFALAAGSRDSAVLVTLSPGSYTAQVSSGGTTSGVAIVEVYEVP